MNLCRSVEDVDAVYIYVCIYENFSFHVGREIAIEDRPKDAVSTHLRNKKIRSHLQFDF